MKKPYILRTTSIKKKNLTKLKTILENKFKIKCYIHKRINGKGNKYYEFSINRKENIKKIKPYLSKENQNKLAKYIK